MFCHEQGGLRTAFDQNDAQRFYLKLSSLAAFDSFLKITLGGAISAHWTKNKYHIEKFVDAYFFGSGLKGTLFY